jgi:DNA polymerase-1
MAFKLRKRRRLYYDLESNGLLDVMDVVHSLVLKDVDTGEVWSCTDHIAEWFASPKRTSTAIVLSVEDALRMLMGAQEVIGQNIIKFDNKGLKQVYPWFNLKGVKITDTLVMSRLIWPDMKASDFTKRAQLKAAWWKKPEKVDELSPKRLIGSHGLEAWGYRLGLWKGDYSKVRTQELIDSFTAAYEGAFDLALAQCDGNKAEMARRVKDKRIILPAVKPTPEEKIKHVWGKWNPDMQAYCEQDVEVTEALYKLIISKKYSAEALELEHAFQMVIDLMEDEGFPFNKKDAEKLEGELSIRKAKITSLLGEAFPPWEIRTPFIPKVTRPDLGYVAGELTHKVVVKVFNPGSREHIADRLKVKYGWKPTVFTDGGKPQIDDSVLKHLDYPEAVLLTEYLVIDKRLGALSIGKNAWLNLIRKDRIYHSVNTNGAVTGRCTHSKPNLAQVPSVKENKDTHEPLLGYAGGWGAEMRALFGPPKGMVQVGADLSGIELRCLGHFMAIWDGGAYVNELLNGDIHTFNQLAAGLPTRGVAKTFIYAYLYGAGDELIGAFVGGGAKEGKALKKMFLDKTPALKEMREAIALKTALKIYVKVKNGKDPETGKPRFKSTQVDNENYVGFLKGLDGRELPCRSPHSALNTLLQSAGAVISKKATVILYEKLTTCGWTFGVDYAFMAHVHDELQMWAKPHLADELGKMAVEAFVEAGEYYNFRCPISGEYKVGENWRDCH